LLIPCVDCVKLDAKNEEYLYLVRTTPDDEEIYILMPYAVAGAVPTAVLGLTPGSTISTTMHHLTVPVDQCTSTLGYGKGHL